MRRGTLRGADRRQSVTVGLRMSYSDSLQHCQIMLRPTILLLICALPASAADFRAIDIGQGCDTVDSWEVAHGSTRIVTRSDPGLEVYSYRVEQFGRRVTVRYLCHYGKLLSAHYDFPLEPWSQAVKTYADTYDSLRSIHGSPAIEDHPTTDLDTQSRSPNHWSTHISEWEDPKSDTVLSIMPGQPSKPELDEWHVLIEVRGHATRLDDLTIGSR
jgi:hypothetical protein